MNLKELPSLLFFIVLAFSLANCQHPNTNKKQTLKSYGVSQGDDSLKVLMDLAQFENFNALYKRTEEIACNDSIPAISFTNKSELHTLFLNNPCWEDYACILIKQRNCIEVHNDTLFKQGKQSFPLDSILPVLTRDYFNHGKQAAYSEHPDKLLFLVSYENEFDGLTTTLNKITAAYEEVTGSRDIKIWLHQPVKLLPPPPPPKKDDLN